MIAMLRGEVDRIELSNLILDVKGVGYEVFVPNAVCVNVVLGQVIKLHIYQHLREDSVRLFGFLRLEEMELFKMLLTVDGVGPKVAMAIFSTYRYEEIGNALQRGEERFFASVSGLGKKTAAKIILELRGKVESIVSEDGLSSVRVNNDVVDAMVVLGYPEHEIMGLMQQIDLTLGVDEQIKAALKLMAKKK